MSNIGISLPSLANSLFSSIAAPSSFQLRSAASGNVSVSAIRTVNPGSTLPFSTALPVFRSNLGAGAGERLLLPGVEASAGLGTTLILQETSGNPATADIQLYDAAGAPIGSKVPVTITPFGVFNDGGQTVSGAGRSVVISNTSSGSARINAYARVQDNATLDSWIVVDPSKLIAPSDTLVMPLVGSPSSTAARVDLYVVNGSASPTDVRVDAFEFSGRRRPVSHSVGSPAPQAGQTLTVRPLETMRTSATASNGYLRISAPAGSISAVGRMTLVRPGGAATYGTALPAVPLSAALAQGQSKRFTAVDDPAATFRSSLLLIETAGGSATVRVTLRYSFAAGLVGARAVSSKEFPLASSQMLLIYDLAGSVIGPQRDSFGDLRNMQVDVEVIDGRGRIVPFLESVDNSSRDLMVRAE